MATALQQQLAAIAANSTHQLDLKAQKARHSKSILFDARDAARQNFDTIYQTCYEGFEELCRLDPRFAPYASTLFSEQSKSEDRANMTAAEIEELDRTIERFLGLLSGRILLKPALKAVEWLIRRFNAHESNTEWLLLTFIPYHTSAVFTTLLSILPSQLPSAFKFLHPYIAAVQNPPRHAVLSAAINNSALFSGLSQYVLRITRSKHHSAVVLGFWASITAQAVNGMADSTKSGRDAIRRQREEDLLLRILPILQSALSIKGVPELYLGCCMIMTILATKITLEEQVLDAMMEAISQSWTEQTVDNGLTCMAVLAEEKQSLSLPKAVAKAILDHGGFLLLLEGISQRHRANKLLLSTITTSMRLSEIEGPKVLALIRLTFDVASLTEQQRVLLAQAVLSQPKKPSLDNTLREAIVSEMLKQSEMVAVVQKEAEKLQIDLQQDVGGLLASTEAEQGDEEPDSMDIDEAAPETALDFSTITSDLPDLKGKSFSFLDPKQDDVFHDYLSAFENCSSSADLTSKFFSIPSLRKKECFDGPTFFSFLARAWSSQTSALTKAKAIQAAVNELKRSADAEAVDLQALLPYLFRALHDPALKVRKAGAALCVQIDRQNSSIGREAKPWASNQLYGSSTNSFEWLKPQDAAKLVSQAFSTHLEDCILDDDHIESALVQILKGLPSSRSESIGQKDLKASLRSAACSVIAHHAVLTPDFLTKLQLLNCLNKIAKPASEARRMILVPFVKHWVSASDVVSASIEQQGVDRQTLDKTILSSLSHRSTEEVQLLKAIASGSQLELAPIALSCLQDLWSFMKSPAQTEIVDFLFDLAVPHPGLGGSEPIQGEALEVLRNIVYPTDVLLHIIETLPTSGTLQDQPPSTKKRRTSKSEAMESRPVDLPRLNVSLRRITIALEIFEASKPERHPQLLKGLFHLLSELNHYKTLLGSQLVYLQGLVLSCLLAVVDGLKHNQTAGIDRSVIRADLIVECVRSTSSSQIHNTALLLISSLASWTPELVLHSVMPLFTFMSNTLLRQSDDFSAHVTDQTVAQIVPPLAASLKKKGKDVVTGASELLLSFTTAFEHIPLHRRQGLFRHLIENLGVEESLFAVTAMLVERYHSHPGMSEFATELMSNSPTKTQLQACKQYLDLVFDGLEPKKTLSEVILGFGDKSAAEIEESLSNLLQSLAEILQSTKLRKRVAKDLAVGGKEAERIQTVYSDLLEQAMLLGREAASNETLHPSADSVLASLLALTPTKDFIEASAKLMQTGSNETRQQVFRSLEARVAEAKRGDAVLQQVYLDVLPNCCVFISDSQPVATRHSAITCVDQIVEKYGKKDRRAVLEAARIVAGGAALASDDSTLRVISMLCLASMVEVLGDDFVSILPQVLMKTLDYLEETLKAQFVNHHIHSAAFGFATSVLDNLPWLFSAGYLDRVLRLAAQSASQSIVADAAQFCAVAAQKIEATELFSAVDRTWAGVVKKGSDATRQHLSLLRRAIQHHTKSTIAKAAPKLFPAVLQAFDLRGKLTDIETDDAIFSSVNDIALDMTLKLNDTVFRPFFIRLGEWVLAGGPQLRTTRAISYYSFCGVLFEQLKSLVTSYASFLLEDAARILTMTKPSTELEQELLRTVVMALSYSFRHDQDDFWQAPAHFDSVALPLVQQLEKAASVPVNEFVVPVVADLAEAAASPEHHKSINTTIMGYMRHSQAAVRLAAVKCERQITERLNLDWLALLPEMLPFISELQEDDDENVERETLRWVAQISEISGESLEGMLQ